MQKESLKILEFLDEFAKNYTRFEFRDDYLENLQTLNLSQTECIYVIDFSKNRLDVYKTFFGVWQIYSKLIF